MTFPGFENIYVLGDPINNVLFRANIETDTNKQTFGLIRGEYKPSSPIEVGYASGSNKLADLTWTTSTVPIIVSDNLINLLELENLTGWNKYEIKLFDKGNNQLQGYSGLSVTGRCGPIDNSKSEEIMQDYPAGKFPNYKGLFFDPESWDGSDLFMSKDGTGWIFITDSVKEAFEKADIKNVQITPVTKLTRSEI